MKKLLLILLSFTILFTNCNNLSNCNYNNLSEVLIKKDSRNIGIDISICKVEDNKIIIDMIAINSDKSRSDVFRYILQVAEELREENFERIEFACKGQTKFYITGRYFKKLGDEYGWQNVVYTNRTFPENVKNIDGTYAFSSWTGGALGVLNKQLDDQLEFHNQWYINDKTID
jgi:hypothetical protein